ncbi:MAG: hypothetical protein K5641_02090 [Lachnospiraceae bacterium]|nr:hypothetical protein [Lachnospiraceae bacterium]
MKGYKNVGPERKKTMNLNKKSGERNNDNFFPKRKNIKMLVDANNNR